MKNMLKIAGIIALVAMVGLSVVSCAQGGTVKIVNKTGARIAGYAVGEKTIPPTDISKYYIEDGKSKSYTFDEDQKIAYAWNGFTGTANAGKSGYGTKDLSGGQTITITAK